MSYCTSDFPWYLGKFIMGFTGMLFLYVGFLRENKKSCVCGPRMRELLRRKSEKQPDRCECAKGENERYPCGCKKPTQLSQDGDVTPTVATEHIKSNCEKTCCMQRNSY